jgi:pimeloyl-ACP methyl ester carboxylesterase
VSDRELTVAGARLRWRDEGAGSALLLIHGWTLDLDMWEPQAQELSRSFRVIRYDRRGFGLSTGRPSLSDDVTDVLTLCEQLQLRSVALLGMSQGARVAAQVAARNPSLVSRVIFDGAPAGIVTVHDGPSDIAVTGLEEWRKHPLTQLHNVEHQELLNRMLARYRAGTEVAAPLPAIEAESIRAPALIISGALDLETRRRAADALASSLPTSERATVPGAGHMPNLDNPPVYNRLLSQFLRNTKS